MKKLNTVYALITATTFIVVVSIFIGLHARGGGGHGGGHGGGGHGGHGGRGRGGHYSHGGRGGRGRGGWGRGGYGRGGYGYGGGWGGFGYGLGLGFALGYPGYWSNGYYYNSEPIVINNSTYRSGEACWNDEIQQWVLCADISIGA